MKLINIGYGNVVLAEKIVAVVSPESAPIKRIIQDAQKQADAKIKEAEHKIMALVDEHEITKQATANANDIISKAQKDGREIKLAAIKYADDLLERVETDVKIVNEKIKQCREGLRQ